MIRSSQHILKFSNKEKIKQLEKLYEDYKYELQLYIDLILNRELPLRKFLSTKYLLINKFCFEYFTKVINYSKIIY